MSQLPLKDIKEPIIFIALKRISRHLINSIWITDIISTDETSIEYRLAQQKSKEYEKDIYKLSEIDLEVNWGQIKVIHADGWKIKEVGDFNPWYTGELTLYHFIKSLESIYEFLTLCEDRIGDAEFKHYFEFLQSYLYEADLNFWQFIHPQITKVSQSKFRIDQYADSVRSAFVELEVNVKRIVKEISGQELSGVTLMQVAFSPKNPIIKLGDTSNRVGLDIQKGYMELYCGSMTGIRNPGAHKNFEIDKKQATHLMFLASLLMSKIDET